MTRQSPAAPHHFAGRVVRDAAGTVIGSAVGLYTDGSPEPTRFIAIRVGHRGRRRVVLVPLAEADVDGDDIRVQAGERLAARSPALSAKHPMCSDDERVLYTHYGLAYPADATTARLHPEAGTTAH